jgi:hypothetical protein
MRSSRRRRLAACVGAAASLAVALPALVLAASPSPTAAAAGDPRSSGQGPGLVGDPLWAIAIVVAIALLSLAATVVYVRATRGRGDAPGR